MKKLIVAAAVVAAFAGVNAQAASTGTITFNGELTATTCDVIVDGQTADATIVLPTVSVNQLTTAGQTAGQTGFNMSLSNCEGTLKTASAFFESGSSVDLVTGRLKNVSGTATNVGLQLRDASSASNAVIQAGNSNQTSNTTYVDVASGSANLPYNVEYYADGKTTAGTVVSNVIYSIQYK
ncbi:MULTISPECIES: fimbrial protein [Serratia]|uniref:Fimbrial protein n=2 Tax=Serratia odorifera TaxID=618 RepID=D4E1P1_SEROD|nr:MULTISPECIES: fimbrial protein [Serratia]QPT13558.1 fimbrial protein [Serratia rubidaea]EFE96266.1 fimbrial protein [Serratia odorifera DSM 4582]MEB6334451.1 fimbrial protein [Serratia rhizosphaerae]PNK90865.1 fimbrial protein [Serratia odorifera]QNK33227.1 fimbrial protein [Serratia sp. JUb9]